MFLFLNVYSCIDHLCPLRLMRKDGWPAMCIHGDKQQKERDWVLGEFKSGSTTILVATDVAARGLDVDDVKFVINYDYPNNSEDYIHRIGKLTSHCAMVIMMITRIQFLSIDAETSKLFTH